MPEETVDLKQLPNPCKLLEPNSHITFGDLHGNAMKLIYIAISEGIMELGDPDGLGRTQQALYDELYEIYNTGRGGDSWISKPTLKQLDTFERILKSSKFTDNAKTCTLVAIGDDLSDRGGSDLLTLTFMDILFDSDVDFRPITSNHGSLAMAEYEIMSECDTYQDYLRIKTANSKPPIIDSTGKGHSKYSYSDTKYQCCSMHGLFYQIEQAGNSQQELYDSVKSKYEKYRKHLRLLDYSIDQEDKLVLYTHAPIDIYYIADIANEFSLMETDEDGEYVLPKTSEELVELIKKINENYMQFKGTILTEKLAFQSEVDSFDDQPNIFKFIWTSPHEHEKAFGSLDYTMGADNDDFFDDVHGHIGKHDKGITDRHENLDNSDIGKLNYVDDTGETEDITQGPMPMRRAYNLTVSPRIEGELIGNAQSIVAAFQPPEELSSSPQLVFRDVSDSRPKYSDNDIKIYDKFMEYSKKFKRLQAKNSQQHFKADTKETNEEMQSLIGKMQGIIGTQDLSTKLKVQLQKDLDEYIKSIESAKPNPSNMS